MDKNWALLADAKEILERKISYKLFSDDDYIDGSCDKIYDFVDKLSEIEDFVKIKKEELFALKNYKITQWNKGQESSMKLFEFLKSSGENRSSSGNVLSSRQKESTVDAQILNKLDVSEDMGVDVEVKNASDANSGSAVPMDFSNLDNFFTLLCDEIGENKEIPFEEIPKSPSDESKTNILNINNPPEYSSGNTKENKTFTTIDDFVDTGIHINIHSDDAIYIPPKKVTYNKDSGYAAWRLRRIKNLEDYENYVSCPSDEESAESSEGELAMKVHRLKKSSSKRKYPDNSEKDSKRTKYS